MGAGTSTVCRKRNRADVLQQLEEGQAAKAGTTFRVEYTLPAKSAASTVPALRKLEGMQFESKDPMALFTKDLLDKVQQFGAHATACATSSDFPGGDACGPSMSTIKLEAASQHALPVLADGHQNGFVNAAVTAFAYHYPISLSPDHFWLLILQAVSKHVEQNAEELRERFVHHEGNQTLTVDNLFTRGSSQNDWAEVVRKLSHQIDNMVMPGVAERLAGGFSTTGLNEDIAAKVTVMEMCKSYFNYATRTICGIPVVTLEGNSQDWTRLRSKAEELVRLQCLEDFAEWWLPSLLPVLEKVSDSAHGNVDRCFWQSFVKRGSTHGSGAHTFISGWINCLFPFAGDGSRNSWCEAYNADSEWARYARGEFKFNLPNALPFGCAHGADEQSFPPGLSKASVKWNYLGTDFPMTFVSGFFAASQDPSTWALRPEVGWAIFEV